MTVYRNRCMPCWDFGGKGRLASWINTSDCICPRKDGVARFSWTTCRGLGPQSLLVFIGILKSNLVCVLVWLPSSHSSVSVNQYLSPVTAHTRIKKKGKKKVPRVLHLNLTLLTTASPSRWEREPEHWKLLWKYWETEKDIASALRPDLTWIIIIICRM